MTIEEMKRIIALLALLALAGCGAGEFSGAGGGMLAVRVRHAASFNPNIEHGRIEMYRVTVDGEGMERPIVATFDGNAEEGIVSGVPTGDNRTVAVEAVNPNDAVIRAGEAFGVKVNGGVTEVPVDMEAVPIFTNIASGNTIDNTRLVFKLFSDPSNPVEVLEYEGDEQTALVDASTNLSEIYLDQSTGLGKFAPLPIRPGKREFEVRDMLTGRSHRAIVLMIDGTHRRPAPLVSTTAVGEGLSGCSAPWCAAL
ncbi:MAG: hypothetical protein WC683_03180 [bacterium]